MNSRIKILAVIVTILTLLAGCRSAPVLNIDSAPIEMTGTHSIKDIKKAILRAGASLGWIMKTHKKGHMLGTLNLRKHMALVDINYDNKSYSIRYKDSKNLDFDGVNIHSNYNGWVSNLNRNIQIQLNTL